MTSADDQIFRKFSAFRPIRACEICARLALSTNESLMSSLCKQALQDLSKSLIGCVVRPSDFPKGDCRPWAGNHEALQRFEAALEKQFTSCR